MSISNIYTQNPNFPNRYISPEKLFFFLQENYSDFIQQVGTSDLNKPIYMLSLGNGDVNILAWSQMHGNESNATHAILDLLEIFKQHPELNKDLFSKISLDFVLMLNPDGSEKWTRRNALDIDINRDFLKESSKEILILKELYTKKKYDYALNLHEQRTIFSTDGVHPATLSFLAPSQDFERTLTVGRKKSMAVISRMFEKLNQLLPNQIARYTDEFYPTSLGDNLMRKGIPNVLFEGGHFPNDYLRKETRKFYTIALYEALHAMADLNGSTEGWENYQQIPQNKETHFDIIYRNVKLNTEYLCVLDIAVQFKEVIEPGSTEISFEPIVVEVGDVGRKKGWQEIDCTGKTFVSEHRFPKLNEKVDFTIE
ncbi:peptidase M14 [Chryseobacterium sp. H3056]|uniref:Peptidase M14 n=1 Tax=Kaistella daneshvariae TaxID=2487074 RepID=A0A3N0X0D9_9FLAO|nr:M14 family zinc carboxypeptidase [Kaistella daneshvariae]ROI10827.1 peptidase M14 [Kaistella daneshvariae]